MIDERSGDLVARWREGNQQAAAELFHRYADQLIALARRRLGRDLRQRLDPEDVVQSVYRSFFAEARAGRFQLERGGDLWRLLVTITLHKLQNQGKHARRASAPLNGNSRSAVKTACCRTPTCWPKSHRRRKRAALADELEHAMRGLEPLHRRMFELRLQGHNFEEIAAATARCERTVRRVLNRVKQQLEEWYAANGGIPKIAEGHP